MSAEKHNKSDNWVVLGKLGAPHGVLGWIRLISFTSPEEGILDYHPWHLKQGDSYSEVAFDEAKTHGKRILIKLPGCETREQAAALTHSKVVVYRSALPALAPDDYYWSDLEGLSVVTPDGNLLGILDHFMETGANDVMVVKQGKTEHLLPYLFPEVVKEVNLTKKEIIVDWDTEF